MRIRSLLIGFVVSVALMVGATSLVLAQVQPDGIAPDSSSPPAVTGTPRKPYSSLKDAEKEIIQQDTAVSDCDNKGFEPVSECYVKNISDQFQADFVLKSLGGDRISGTGVASAYGRGAIGGMTNMIAHMYKTPPANTETYVAYLMNSAGMVSPAYAQGLGFAALSPILTAWTTFRNLAYIFFVLIFLAIGFMIMLRQKISGQTVVTAQQAIPQIIVSLVLVTFSYAIAGLLIDLMYLIMFLLIGIFGYQADLLGHNFLQIGGIMMRGGVSTTYEAVESFIEGGLGGVSTRFDVVDVAGFVGGLIATVVIAIAMLIGMFQLFFELLQVYASIMISIVLSPITLMMGAIPGRNAFGGWIRNLIGNLSAFPTLLLVLIIYDQVTGSIGSSLRVQQPSTSSTDGTVYAQATDTTPGYVDLNEGGFVAPFLGGQGNSESMTFLFGLALLLAMKEIIKQTRKSLGAKDEFAWFTGAVSTQLKSAWRGDVNLIPGVGLTNLSKSPLTKWMGGLSGANVATKMGIGAAGVGGGAFGAYRGMFQEGIQTGSAMRGMGASATNWAGRMIDWTEDPTFKAWREKQKQNQPQGAQVPPKLNP